MTNLNELKTNDVIIRFGQVYQVFKIEEKDGKNMIFYKKFFKNGPRAVSIFSIPQESIEKTKIRKALTKQEMDHLLGEGLKEAEVDLDASLNTIKAILNTDDPAEVVKTLKLLAILKHKNDKLPFSKKEIYGSLIKRLTSEVAYVYDTEQDGAQEIIEKALADYVKDIPKTVKK